MLPYIALLSRNGKIADWQIKQTESWIP